MWPVELIEGPQEEAVAPEKDLKEEQERSKEELEEIVIPAAELARPLEKLEAAGVVDDLVRMYLYEIGQVPLLTADDEKRLAKQVEKGQHLSEIKECCHRSYGREPSTVEIIQCMLREIGQAATLIDGLQKELGIKPGNSFKKVIFDQQLRQAIDNQIDQRLTLALSQSLNRPLAEIEQIIIHLSLNSSLLPSEVLEHIGNEVTLEGVIKLAERSGLYQVHSTLLSLRSSVSLMKYRTKPPLHRSI